MSGVAAAAAVVLLGEVQPPAGCRRLLLTGGPPAGPAQLPEPPAGLPRRFRCARWAGTGRRATRARRPARQTRTARNRSSTAAPTRPSPKVLPPLHACRMPAATALGPCVPAWCLAALAALAAASLRGGGSGQLPAHRLRFVHTTCDAAASVQSFGTAQTSAPPLAPSERRRLRCAALSLCCCAARFSLSSGSHRSATAGLFCGAGMCATGACAAA